MFSPFFPQLQLKLPFIVHALNEFIPELISSNGFVLFQVDASKQEEWK